ncbi:hypothetical protein H2248_004325 [Termitomyces sp. 'cryptogamus']|nr:hypothetical protein H2248_004325 [Termitomyces sp. 'cryptogamus']
MKSAIISAISIATTALIVPITLPPPLLLVPSNTWKLCLTPVLQTILVPSLMNAIYVVNLVTPWEASVVETLKEMWCIELYELYALQCSEIFDGVEVPCTKGYCSAPPSTPAPAAPARSDPAPTNIPAASFNNKGKAPELSTCPTSPAQATSASNPQPPLHLFSGIHDHYVPPKHS